MSWAFSDTVFIGSVVASMALLAIATLSLLRSVRPGRFFSLLFWIGVLGSVMIIADEQSGLLLLPRTPYLEVLTAFLIFLPLPICLMAIAAKARKLRIEPSNVRQVFE